MIVSKTPYRIPLSGGGTDIDFYYKKFGSRFSSVCISEYVYVYMVTRKLDDNYMIQTSKVEFPQKINQINHKLIRETIKFFKIKEKLQISTFSSVPTSTGLGTSSALVIGLIKCILEYKKIKLSQSQIFKITYHIERKTCRYAGGWQDQIASEFGGFIDVEISKKEKIKIFKKKNIKNIQKIVNKHFLLVYSKKKRDSSLIIKSQMKNLKKTYAYYNEIKKLNNPIIKSINDVNIKKLGKLFSYHWNLKKCLTKNISNKKLDNLYSEIMSLANVLGGKLIGAGGGGFFLIVVKNKKDILSSLTKKNLNYVDLKFENNGSLMVKI